MKGYHVSVDRARAIVAGSPVLNPRAKTAKTTPTTKTTQHAERIDSRKTKDATFHGVLGFHGFKYVGHGDAGHVYVHPRALHVVIHDPKGKKWDWHFHHGGYHGSKNGTFPNTSGKGFEELDNHLNEYTS